jgi:hypothetical protein
VNKTCASVIQLEPRRLGVRSRPETMLAGSGFLAHLRAAA